MINVSLKFGVRIWHIKRAFHYVVAIDDVLKLIRVIVTLVTLVPAINQLLALRLVIFAIKAFIVPPDILAVQQIARTEARP